jgi:PTH1 family peptidyl-tRNA hydrolase
VGFEVLEHLARREGLLFEPPESLEGYHGPPDFSSARLFLPDALLVKPGTFMNRSGLVVLPLLRWAGVGPESTLVVVDDLDLPLGKLRIRPSGSSGGHNGLKSIIETLGTDRFPRLRVGIGRSQTEAARHVLARFTPEEREPVERALAEAADAVHDWLLGGDIQACMTRYHSRWNQGSEQ